MTLEIASLALAAFVGPDILRCSREDLTDMGFIELLLRILSRGFVSYLHSGIECTTWSIAAKPAYRIRGPNGVDLKKGLAPHNLHKVERANWFMRFSILASTLILEGGGHICWELPTHLG